jgi:hypothetical protein
MENPMRIIYFPWPLALLKKRKEMMKKEEKMKAAASLNTDGWINALHCLHWQTKKKVEEVI